MFFRDKYQIQPLSNNHVIFGFGIKFLKLGFTLKGSMCWQQYFPYLGSRLFQNQNPSGNPLHNLNNLPEKLCLKSFKRIMISHNLKLCSHNYNLNVYTGQTTAIALSPSLYIFSLLPSDTACVQHRHKGLLTFYFILFN